MDLAVARTGGRWIVPALLLLFALHAGAAAEPVELPPPRQLPPAAAAPFPGRDELSAENLVAGVLARNPSLAQMVAAWQAASARYPQVTSLDDPMLGVQLAPGAWTSRELNAGVRVEV